MQADNRGQRMSGLSCRHVAFTYSFPHRPLEDLHLSEFICFSLSHLCFLKLVLAGHLSVYFADGLSGLTLLPNCKNLMPILGAALGQRFYNQELRPYKIYVINYISYGWIYQFQVGRSALISLNLGAEAGISSIIDTVLHYSEASH